MMPIQQWSPQDILEFFKKMDPKTWVKVGIFTAAGLLLFAVVIWPAWVWRLDLHRKIRQYQMELDQVKTLGLRKPEFEKTKVSTIQFIEGSKDRIFKPGETSLLLGAISKLADDSKVSILASSPQDYSGTFPAPFDTQYEASLYDFTVQGAYHAVGEFVGRVESYEKLLLIREFHLLPSKDKADIHLAELTVSAVSYKQAVVPK